MPDVDWAVWPIFALQIVAFLLLLLPARWHVFRISIRSIVIFMLVLSAIAIVVSLYHDITIALKLYF